MTAVVKFISIQKTGGRLYSEMGIKFYGTDSGRKGIDWV